MRRQPQLFPARRKTMRGLRRVAGELIRNPPWQTGPAAAAAQGRGVSA